MRIKKGSQHVATKLHIYGQNIQRSTLGTLHTPLLSNSSDTYSTSTESPEELLIEIVTCTESPDAIPTVRLCVVLLQISV